MRADKPLNPICLVIDTPSVDRVNMLVDKTRDEVGMFKVGLTTVYGAGIDVIRDLDWQRPLFVDAKLHDIPKQIEGAVAGIRRLGADLVTVHAAGGSEMIKAAVAAADGDLAVLAVTVLTSLDDTMTEMLGWRGSVSDTVASLADVAINAGADGLVCSAHEVADVRARVGDQPLLVVPGIREVDAGDDQRRTMGPQAAIEAGADVLVIGRPISEAPDVAEAARRIRSQLA